MLARAASAASLYQGLEYMLEDHKYELILVGKIDPSFSTAGFNVHSFVDIHSDKTVKLVHSGAFEFQVGTSIDSHYALLWQNLVQTELNTIEDHFANHSNEQGAKRIMMVPCEPTAQE